MRAFSQVAPKFWIGASGKALRGNPEAQVLALYLMTSPHANAIGVYHCPMLYICHETGLSAEGASKALRRLIDGAFCEYETETETVFVKRMAAYQIAEQLRPGDKRVPWVRKEWQAITSPALKATFLSTYGRAFLIQQQTPDPPESARGIEGASGFESRERDGDGDGDGERDAPDVAPAKRSRRSRATPLPTDFNTSDKVKKWARSKGYGDLDLHLEAFRDKCAAKAYSYADWDAAFMTAIRQDWAGLRAKPRPNGISDDSPSPASQRRLS